MHFGLFLNPETPGPDDDLRIIHELLEECALAERLGFSGVWLTEHHFSGFNAYADPVVFSAALAQRLRRMVIGYAVAVLPIHHPIRFAVQTALVDNLAEGRLIVGIAPGNGPPDFNGFGVPLDERGAMTEEAIDLLLEAWTAGDDGFCHEGHYYRAKGQRIIPRPFQQPHPLLIRAVTSPETTDLWARRGFPAFLGNYTHGEPAYWLGHYEERLRSADYDDPTVERAMRWTGILKTVYLAESDDQAVEEAIRYAKVGLIASELANRGVLLAPEEIDEARIERFMSLFTVIGSPKTVRAKLAPFYEAGMQHIILGFRFGDMPAWLVARNMRLFSEEVLPHFTARRTR